MWYAIQTITGQEEKLVRMVKRILPETVYEDCFVTYYERIWRRQQQSVIHVERLFPGYVFIISENPDAVYQKLKDVPAMSRLVSDGMFTFLPLEEDEKRFFQDMFDGDHVIRISYVEKDDKGMICRIAGPIAQCVDQVVRWQYKKRYALIGMRLLGKEKQICLGIILKEDAQHAISYGKIEAPVTCVDVYQTIEDVYNYDTKR